MDTGVRAAFGEYHIQKKVDGRLNFINLKMYSSVNDTDDNMDLRESCFYLMKVLAHVSV